jgi:DNA-binding winged helix-turn-helix (wHTH) protein
MSEGGRAVDTTIAKLRRKLEAASPEYRYIHTQHGIGYWFEAMPVPALPSPLPHRRASSEPAPQVSLA